jgi:hypothetical protein
MYILGNCKSKFGTIVALLKGAPFALPAPPELIVHALSVQLKHDHHTTSYQFSCRHSLPAQTLPKTDSVLAGVW